MPQKRGVLPQSPNIIAHATPECPDCIAEILAEVEQMAIPRNLDTVTEKRRHIPESNHKPFGKVWVKVEAPIVYFPSSEAES